MTRAWPMILGGLLIAGSGTLPARAHDALDQSSTLLVYSNPHQGHGTVAPVTVTMARDGDVLVAHFKVTAAAIVAKRQLAHDEYPYDFDVVELFVRNAKSGQPGYFEFEVSPYDQSLQVNVIEPRQQYCFGIKDGFTHTANITATGWEAQLRIPLATHRLAQRPTPGAGWQCLCGAGCNRTTRLLEPLRAAAREARLPRAERLPPAAQFAPASLTRRMRFTPAARAARAAPVCTRGHGASAR